MIQYKDIKGVHLEITTKCNARCPWCIRNFWGYPYNDGYPEVNMTIDNCKKIFKPEFVAQLESIVINGNFGDIIMNPDGLAIVEYFRSSSPTVEITISTNASGRNAEFWQGLARARATVVFGIDGLADTHKLYRQNTSYDVVLKNAATFIAAGGDAIWAMIKFKHNEHQIEECRALAKSMGFREFAFKDDGRDTGPVFDTNGNLVHTLGNYTGEKEFKILFYKKTTDTVMIEDVVGDTRPKASIQCHAKKNKTIYIAATGEVSPCCETGTYPHTFGHGQYFQAVNSQLAPIAKNNNALEHGLENSLEWFNDIQKSWAQTEFNRGRLLICNNVCGIE